MRAAGTARTTTILVGIVTWWFALTTSTAQAQEPPPIRLIGFQSTLTVCVAGTCEPYEQPQPVATMQVVPMNLPTGDGDQYAPVYCNRSYSWTDSNGTFSYQHSCGGATSPWGYSISPGVRSIVSGHVSESGMTWFLNGAAKSKMAPHSGVSPAYVFHGTFNPVKKSDGIEYNDYVTFNCNLGPGCHGTITIHGALRQVT